MAVDNGLDIALPLPYLMYEYVLLLLRPVSFDFFHIGNKTSHTVLLLYITKAYLCLAEVCEMGGGGAKT